MIHTLLLQCISQKSLGSVLYYILITQRFSVLHNTSDEHKLCFKFAVKGSRKFLQCYNIHHVAYRPIIKWWLHKQRSFLRNSWVNTFMLIGSRFLIMQQLNYNNGNRVFLCGLCQDIISKGQSQLRVSSVWRSVKKGPECMKLKNIHC
jgi:hypothetical protein